ncbi:MAG TPA: LysE family translocator [Pyrinomonadaceae bacterium]|jgi:threonine/homoserine/homoserine lactone efflux protein
MKTILDWSSLSLFISVAAILVFMPGPNTLYIIARSIQQGRLAGFVSSLGVQIGTMVHMVAAALGLSALLLSSAVAFSVVKYAGAAYLVFLGLRTLLAKEKIEKAKVKNAKLSRIFYQGVVVNVLNPKTTLFFFAFLPQFIEPRRGAVALQVILLGTILIFLGTLSDSLYALASGSIGNWLRGNLKFVRAQRYFAGSVYIGLGAATAFTGVHKK